MKRVLFLACLVLWGILPLFADNWKGEGTGFVTGMSGVSLKQGAFQMCREGVPFCRITFENPKEWLQEKNRNYGSRVKMEFGTLHQGEKCLRISFNSSLAGKDTAWQMETGRIPYCGKGMRFVAEIRACADFTVAKPDGKGYRNTINWYDTAGNFLSQRYLRMELKPDGKFAVVRTTGSIPAGAKSFRLTIGFDNPNIPREKFLAISEIRLLELEDRSPVVPEALVEFLPQPLEQKQITWQADFPAGTTLQFQIAEAEDARGVPGEWGSWHGPDGTPNSWFTAPFQPKKPWGKLRMKLTGKGIDQPVLKELTIGGFRQTNWELFEDKFSPLVENLTHSPSMNRREKIVLRITGDSPVNWRSFYVQVDWRNVTGKFQRVGNVLTYEPVADLKDGLHRIDLVIANMHGKWTRSTKYLLIGESPKGVPHSELRDDGILLIDGKPVFPIGVYAVWKREFNHFDFDKAFQDLAENGFNFAQTYKTGPEYTAFLDAAHKHNIHIWSVNFQANPQHETLQKRLSYPAITAWYIGDDTSDNSTPAALQDRHDALRAIDAHRITVQADHVTSALEVSDYRHYVRGADGFLPEIYPVLDDSAEDRGKSVAEVIRDMRAIQRDIAQNAARHPPCVWALLQHFKGWGGWLRFPEAQECRAMAYAAIVYGATGITWYTYGGYKNPKTGTANYGVTSTPERWQAITTVTRQLRELEPILTERTPPEQPHARVLSGPDKDAAGNPSISCLLKKHDGTLYLIVVNSTLQEIQAEIPVKGAKAGTVLFENRSAPVSNGKITDRFKPYDVHVYRLK